MKHFPWKLIISALMVFIYLAMGILLVFTQLFDIAFTFRVILGVVFVAYGIFRAYRLFRQL
ncbi:MAG: hypothetical protein LBS16_00805 [Prevotellaceae bacterium]|jgi:uncharacterized membrane protein HdeD (DUF308 family)|nr:hypothetical protein [Prevotellaceae bacterium]